MDESSWKVNINVLRNICKALAELMCDMLGPAGNQTLLTSSTSRAYVIRNGVSVLSSVNITHPVARYIVKSLQGFHSATGDGSKTFIIYLSELLDQVESISDDINVLGTTFCKRYWYENFAAHISQKFNSFLHEDFVDILGLFTKRLNSHQGQGAEYMERSMKSVLRTSLASSLPFQFAHFFGDILWTLLCVDDQNPIPSITDKLSHVLKTFDSYFVKVTGYPVQHSRVTDGILLCDTGTCRNVREGVSCVRIVLVNDICENLVQSKTVFAPSSKEFMIGSFFHKRDTVEAFLHSLKAANVELILSVEKLPQYVLSMCREWDISVIHTVDKTKMEFIQLWTGACFLSDMRDGPAGDCVFTAEVCRIFHLETAPLVLLRPFVKKTTPLVMRQIVLCAPTEGLNDQIFSSLCQALKSLHACFLFSDTELLKPLPPASVWKFRNQTCDALFDDSNTSTKSTIPYPAAPKHFFVIGGGGTFEALLSTVIQDYYKESDRSFQNRVIGLLVEKMLVAAPRKLYANLSSVNTCSGQKFLQQWTRMLAMARQEYLVGFNEFGELVDTASTGILEPVACKMFLVKKTIELVQQLLLLERVICCLQPDDLPSRGEQ